MFPELDFVLYESDLLFGLQSPPVAAFFQIAFQILRSGPQGQEKFGPIITYGQQLNVGANYHPHDDKNGEKIKRDIQLMNV